VSPRRFSHAERVLGIKIADYIGTRRAAGAELLDVLDGINTRWPGVSFDVVFSAILLHYSRTVLGEDYRA
jgi:hypothetical protein